MAHTATLTWTGDGETFDTVTGSGIDGKIGVNADGVRVGPRAKEMVVLGLGACGGVNLVNLMKKMRQPVQRIEIDVQADQAETDPQVFTHVLTRYRLYGKGIDPAKVKKALDYIEDKYCGVLHMINKTAKTEYAFEIVEE